MEWRTRNHQLSLLINRRSGMGHYCLGYLPWPLPLDAKPLDTTEAGGAWNKASLQPGGASVQPSAYLCPGPARLTTTPAPGVEQDHRYPRDPPGKWCCLSPITDPSCPKRPADMNFISMSRWSDSWHVNWRVTRTAGADRGFLEPSRQGGWGYGVVVGEGNFRKVNQSTRLHHWRGWLVF